MAAVLLEAWVPEASYGQGHSSEPLLISTLVPLTSQKKINDWQTHGEGRETILINNVGLMTALVRKAGCKWYCCPFSRCHSNCFLVLSWGRVMMTDLTKDHLKLFVGALLGGAEAGPAGAFWYHQLHQVCLPDYSPQAAAQLPLKCKPAGETTSKWTYCSFSFLNIKNNSN